MHRGREFQGVEKGSIGKRWVNKNSKDLLKISYNFLRGKLQPEIIFFKMCSVLPRKNCFFFNRRQEENNEKLNSWDHGNCSASPNISGASLNLNFYQYPPTPTPFSKSMPPSLGGWQHARCGIWFKANISKGNTKTSNSLSVAKFNIHLQ